MIARSLKFGMRFGQLNQTSDLRLGAALVTRFKPDRHMAKMANPFSLISVWVLAARSGLSCRLSTSAMSFAAV